tara:strand:+ start:560 stop:1612 length:1053 start_codon:yes stop_codon:yes gene_type:complete
MTKTTLIIPTLNSEKYLNETLNSLSQNKKSIFKIFIIDAGSDDKTISIIKKTKLKKLYVFLLKANIAQSLDFGLSKAKTKYFSRIDSDDIAKKNRFKKQLNLLKNNKDLAVVGSNFSTIKDKKIISVSDLPLSHESIITKFLTDGDISLAHPATTLKVQCVKNVGGYENLDFSEDYNLWIKLIFKKYKICNLVENLTDIRIHTSQKSEKTKEKTTKFMMHSYVEHVGKNLGIKLNSNYLKLLMIKYLKKDNLTKNEINKYYLNKFYITKKKFEYFQFKINFEELISFELQNINYRLNFFNFIYYFYKKKNYILKINKFIFKEKTNYFIFYFNFYIHFIFLILKYFLVKFK